MAYAKNQTKSSKGGKTSKTLHATRPATKTSRRAHDQTIQRRIFNISRQTILTIIIIASLMVILAVLYGAIATPEHLVKHKIQNLAETYYETYFYENLLTYAPTDKSLDEIMSSYAEHGFASVTLDQLLLSSSQRHTDAGNLLTTYCDEKSTTIRIYPHAPYGRSDYEIKYNYSCNF